MLTKRQKKLLLGVVIVLAVMRLALIPKGHFFMQDELRYRYSLAFVREMILGNFLQATRQLYEPYLALRPGLVLINLPAAIIQAGLLVIFGLKTETPLSLTIPVVINVLVSLVISWLMFRLAFRWTRSFILGLAAMWSYSLLVNTNLYLRHVLPYDFALMGYLIVLERILLSRSDEVKRHGFGLGIVTGLIYSIYPGFYAFPIVLTITGLWVNKKVKWWWLRWWIGGGGLAYGGLLGLGALVNKDFLFLAWQYAKGGQTMGDVNETWLFLWRYLLRVETITGVLVSVLFGWWWLKFNHATIKKEVRVVLTSLAAVYLFHSGVAVMLKKMVFYGRLLHMYLPFVVLAAVLAIRTLPKTWQNWLTVLLVSSSLVSWLNWYPRFFNLVYPDDVLWSVCQDRCLKTSSLYRENLPPNSEAQHIVDQSQLVAINFTRDFIHVIENGYDYTPQGAKLVYQADHPVNFLAYQFEGYSLKERQLLAKLRYQMKLYKLR